MVKIVDVDFTNLPCSAAFSGRFEGFSHPRPAVRGALWGLDEVDCHDYQALKPVTLTFDTAFITQDRLYEFYRF